MYSESRKCKKTKLYTKSSIGEINIRGNLFNILFFLTLHLSPILDCKYFSFLIHRIFSPSLFSPLISSFPIHPSSETFAMAVSALCATLLPQEPTKRQNHHLQAVDALWQLPPPGPGFVLSRALRAIPARGGFRISMLLLSPRRQRGSRRDRRY